MENSNNTSEITTTKLYRQKRGRPKRSKSQDEIEQEKYTVAQIIRLIAAGFTKNQAWKMLAISESTNKTLYKKYSIDKFVQVHNLDIDTRLNQQINAFLNGELDEEGMKLEVNAKDDLSFDERVKLLSHIAQNNTLDVTQRIQAIKALGDLKGDKVKKLPEGELIELKLYDMFEPEETEEEQKEKQKEPDPEQPTMDKAYCNDREITTEFVFDEDNNNEIEDLFNENDNTEEKDLFEEE